MNVYLDDKRIAEINRSDLTVTFKRVYMTDIKFVDRAFKKLNKIFRGFNTEAKLFRRKLKLRIEVKGREFPVYWNEDTIIIDIDGDFFGNASSST